MYYIRKITKKGSKKSEINDLEQLIMKINLFEGALMWYFCDQNHRRIKKMKANIYILSMTIVLSLCSCKPASKEMKAAAAVSVKTMMVENSSEVGYRSYVGTVEEASGSQLSFATMGTVSQVLVDEGQAVRKGQVLAVLDKTTLQNAYDIARSTLRQAEDGYKRLYTLYKKGSLPEVKYIEIQTQLAQAQAGERIARKNIRDCVLRAPFSGYISQKMVDTGNNIVPGEGCFKLVKLDRVKVKIAVPEKEISSIHRGENIGFSVAALGNQNFEGKVKEIGVQANPFSHTYDVKIELANNGHLLLPGMVCSVSISTTNESGCIIPQEAVMTNGNNTYVWIAKNNQSQKRDVKTGGVNDRGVIITDGLIQGDEVIVNGQNNVSEGTKIQIR